MKQLSRCNSLVDSVQLFRNDDLNKRLKTDVERLSHVVNQRLAEVDSSLANNDAGRLQQQLHVLKVVAAIHTTVEIYINICVEYQVSFNQNFALDLLQLLIPVTNLKEGYLFVKMGAVKLFIYI
jgi:hypothetical protein